MKAVRRMRLGLAAAGLAASLLVLPADAQAVPGGVTVTVGCERSAGCGVLLVTCGPGGQVTAVVRLAGTPPLLPLGGLTVRIGEPCGPSATVAPSTVPPSVAPSTVPPSVAPSVPASVVPTVPPSAPASVAPTGAAPTAGPEPAPAPGGAATTAPGPVPAGPAPPAASPAAGPAAFGPAATRTAARLPQAAGSPARPTTGPTDTAGYAPPPFADEPYDRGPGDAARWWLLTMAVVLLPAALAALPYRHIRRRH